MVLLIGFGNPGRGDDGLGPALAGRIERHAIPGVEVKTSFQLAVEHALDVKRADAVVFADADLAAQGPYVFSEVFAGTRGHLDSHNVSPESVMTLAKHLFGSTARGFLIAIAGTEFREIKEELSEPALANLELAEAFLVDWLKGAGPKHGVFQDLAQ